MTIKDLILDKSFQMLSLLFLIAVVVCACLISVLVNVQNEKRRLTSNIETLTSQVVKFRTSDGRNAAQVKTLTLTTAELKEQNAELIAELKTINVKPREVKSIQQVSAEATYAIPLVKEDTISSDTLQITKYSYKDDWISVDAICLPQNDTCTATIVTRDSLLVVQHCKTRKILCWTWKKYSGQATVKNYNPYSEIQSVRNIDIEK